MTTLPSDRIHGLAWLRRLSPGAVSRLASMLLIGIFIALAGFVVVRNLQDQALRDNVSGASALSGAYEEAKLAVSEAEAAAYRYIGTADATARPAFDRAVEDTEVALQRIMSSGHADDRALVAEIYRDYLPADWLSEDDGAKFLVGNPAKVAEEFFRALSLRRV